MMRKANRGRNLLAACLLLVVACGDDADSLRPLPENAVILAFGDSLTHGTGVRPEESYPAALQSLTRRTVINAGVPGEVTADGVRRLPGLLDRHRPGLLILIHGGNDILRRHSEERTIANLKAMIAEARRRDIDIVMLAVPRPTLLLSPAGFYAALAEESGVPIDVDAIADILQYPANKSDAIHPNATGYRMMAERVRELLADNGAL